MLESSISAEILSRPIFNEASLSPEVMLSKIYFGEKTYFIARDDLLPGGSKQRACAPLLQALAAQGFDHFFYASPFCGFAQVALAYVCQQLNLKCQIFCEKAPAGTSLSPKHAFAELAENYGAKMHMVDNLETAEILADIESRKLETSFKIPLGFNCDEFKDAFEKELRLQWAIVKKKLGQTPATLWLPVGSGTLLSVFSRIVDTETQIKCVNVHVLGSHDSRIKAIANNSRYKLYAAPEKFCELAVKPPNVPSNIHYDAKIWQFLIRYGKSGDVWWNVAR